MQIEKKPGFGARSIAPGFYKDYAAFLAEHFPGRKMQKLTVDAGFSCPNRDGTLSRGGCAYCNNSSFSPTLAPENPRSTLAPENPQLTLTPENPRPDKGTAAPPPRIATDGDGGYRCEAKPNVATQLEKGKAFFSRKYPSMRYLAYFQSYTNTHGDIGRLLSLYDEALATEGVDGLIIGTRPDCLPPPLLDALAARRRNGAWIMLELGAESSHDETLARVNRCHTWEQTVEAVRRVKEAGLPVGLHFIMGLPGETREMMLETVRRAALLEPDTVKFHQLQIIRGSRFGAMYEQDPVSLSCCTLFTPEQYLTLCVEIIGEMNRLAPATAIERFTSSAPSSLLLAPRWGLKNYEFVNRLNQFIIHNS